VRTVRVQPMTVSLSNALYPRGHSEWLSLPPRPGRNHGVHGLAMDQIVLLSVLLSLVAEAAMAEPALLRDNVEVICTCIAVTLSQRLLPDTCGVSCASYIREAAGSARIALDS
jgi:hypothetical protein